ncbi:MAG: hypothetical protein KDA58_01630 [Planctomycetaceae bacterium]|nr:hypothetical protein [Planctomycetaceae bacterium]
MPPSVTACSPLRHALFGVSVAGVLCLVTASAQCEWTDVRERDGLILRSEFSLGKSGADQLLNDLDGLQSDVLTTLQLKPGTGIVEFHLFRGKSTYQEYLRIRVPEGASRPALFVKGDDRARVYVYRHWGYEKDVRHEGTHAVLHNALPFVPMWLDEGLAEYFEVLAKDRIRANPHQGELKRRILFGWKPDLKRLQNKTKLSEMDGADYRESWAWVHFMLHGPEDVRQQFHEYLADVQAGRAAGLLGDRLLSDVVNTEERLVQHIRHWK